jgi:hypothetical protein
MGFQLLYNNYGIKVRQFLFPSSRFHLLLKIARFHLAGAGLNISPFRKKLPSSTI